MDARARAVRVAPIVGLAAVGSLMFAFPLAFDFGDSGAVIAMLGLLICSCSAGWGMMAARRVGYTWPGLPDRGSGRRADWRVVTAYAVMVAAVFAPVTARRQSILTPNDRCSAKLLTHVLKLVAAA